MNLSFRNIMLLTSSQRAMSHVPIWRKRLLWGLLGMMIILPLSGALYQAAATEIDKRTYPPTGQLIDVGGYRLHLYCIGKNTNGRATVVLEPGLGGISTNLSIWAWVQPEIAKTTRVCSYDRAGLGWSDPGPQPRDAQHIVTELHLLLQNAHIPGPYVLVGWSYGGLYIRAYANQYRSETAGLVLLDSSSPDQCASTPDWQAMCASNTRMYTNSPILARLGIIRAIGLFQPASGLPDLPGKELLSSFSATKDWEALKAEDLASSTTNAQVLGEKTFSALPLFVLTATDHGAPPNMEQQWQVWQSGFTLLSTNSVQRIVPGATHASLVFRSTDARITVESILRVVEAARTGKQLK